MFIEGHRSGTAFRACGLAWLNGSPISAEISAELKAQGYKLRPAADEEVFRGDPPTQITAIKTMWTKARDEEYAGA
ncbi:MAG TPA: hypothetical protein VGI19_04795 [Candidatus Cybelea sp.]|jgi:hypothetical protein